MPIYTFPFPANLTKHPSFSVHLTDATVYSALLAAFRANAGYPFVVGMAPTEVAAFCNCRITDASPDGHATTYDNWNDLPCVIVTSQELNGSAPPPINQGSGPLPDGQIWAWLCDVEFYTGTPPVLPTNAPLMQVKVGSYVGNGVNGNAVNVGFNMSTPAYASAWTKPLSGSGPLGEWKTKDMVGGSLPTQGQALDANGITGFTATGFTLGTNNRCNQNGVTYGYVAMVDVSGKYMRTGKYTGVGNIGSGNITAVQGSNILTGVGFSPNWKGCILDVVTHQYCITDASATQLTIAPAWIDPSVTTSGTILGDNRFIVTAQATDPLGGNPTHVWSDGFGGGAYKSSDIPDPKSTLLPLSATNPRTTSIIKLGPPSASPCAGQSSSGYGYSVGVDDSVNRDGKDYYWVAIKSDAQVQANILQSGRFVAAGSDAIAGLPWQPGWATTQQEANNTVAVWRAQGAQVGTDSTGWGADGGGNTIDFPANGITAFTAGGFTTGAGSTPAGKTIDWFAFKGSGSITPTVPVGPLVGTCPNVVGVVNLPFFAVLTAVGGTAPYTYTLILGGLPPGLVLDPATGQITGIPTTAGDYPYVVQIVDATLDPSLTSSVTCSITINPKSNTPTPPTPDPLPGTACLTGGMNAATADVTACRTSGMVGAI